MRYGLRKQQARNLDRLDEEAETQIKALKLRQRMADIMAAAKDELSLMLKAEEQLQRAELDMQKLQPAAKKIEKRLYKDEQPAIKKLVRLK